MAEPLTASQRDHMNDHIADVWFMQATLGKAGRETTNEDAYRAWSEHSDRSAAGWLIVDRDENGKAEILHAHDALIESRRPKDHRREDLEPLRNETIKANGRRETAGEGQALRDLVEIGFSPIPDQSRTPESVQLMNHIAGRLNNVQYMANAIDEADGIPPANRAPSVRGGKQQYEHLMSDRMAGMRGTALCYNALRQAQREGDQAGLRTGLAMIVLADQGVIGHQDVLAAMGRDGLTATMREAGLANIGGKLVQTAAALPAPTRASIAKGPSQPALPAPARSGPER